eukprot:SAG25_NODE_225_length_11569_cov_7.091107_4_plen_176_part_00
MARRHGRAHVALQERSPRRGVTLPRPFARIPRRPRCARIVCVGRLRHELRQRPAHSCRPGRLLVEIAAHYRRVREYQNAAPAQPLHEGLERKLHDAHLAPVLRERAFLQAPESPRARSSDPALASQTEAAPLPPPSMQGRRAALLPPVRSPGRKSCRATKTQNLEVCCCSNEISS